MAETTETAELDALIATLMQQASSLLQRQFDELHARRVEGDDAETLNLTAA
jgi:hypothetical protein